MATCIIKDTSLPSIYCQTTNSMKQSSSFESLNQRCQFNFHVTTISMDPTTLFKSQELSRKRQLNRSNTYNSKSDLTERQTGNNCSTQAVSADNSEISSESNRPKTLLVNDSGNNLSVPLFRTCLSHPSTSSSPLSPIDDDISSPLKFTSLPILTYPPAKRLRPRTLPLVTTNLSVPVLSTANLSLSISYIDSSALVDKLNESSHMIIFDCGSPFRYTENHISNAKLLRVSDKISRKRLKSNPSKQSIINLEQLNECNAIVLYDDNDNNHRDLSAGIKCACEEIQRCLTNNKYPSLFILQNSFEQFFNLYPNLCESLQSSNTPDESSPTQLTPTTDLLDCPMTHIIDGLYIGSESNAKNLEELSSENIRYIINVTSHVPLYHTDQFHYYHIPADDTQKQNLLDYFDQAYTFIQNAIRSKEKILVHCVAGISRSPAIVISFLMRYARMSMNDAYDFVKTKRSIVSPNLNFMGQLLQYEKKLREQT